MNLPPATHNADPATAHAAEERHTSSGKRQRNWQAVLNAVRASPGLTAAGYGDNKHTDLGHHEAQRRLSDLQSQGLVRKGGDAFYGRRRMKSWWPVGDETQGALV